ncbi:hypothetical protein [Lysinibacter cavernae]|uniref:Uncharacterized protein n=1 Tax=Lysinibacter cavernae TaxID=1640652 RepID=A0A7X5R0B5_9MICO|nr:hypothetical protein [Lysinibacter cavernae]NIH53266.1 hypothetical protein [Lysinibacter cavernae]
MNDAFEPDLSVLIGADEPSLLDGIPASAPIVQVLRDELTELCQMPDVPQEFKARVRGILSGQLEFRALSESPLIPAPKPGDELPRALEAIASQIHMGVFDDWTR